MAVVPQKFRELVLQLLYSYDLGRAADEDMVELMAEELALSKKTIREGLVRVRSIWEYIDSIDAMIAQTSQSYAFERIQTVERNILRLAVYELLYDPSIPPAVVIAESLRLARKFSTKESAHFVNAIIDTIHKKSINPIQELP